MHKVPQSYVPHLSGIPHLQVPENRVKYVADFYRHTPDHLNNFPCYAYWIERCEGEGSDY